jgi:hypothetical protein
MMKMAEDERLTGPEGLKKTTQREEQKEEDGKKEKERLKQLEHSIDETMDDTELPPDILDADSDSASVYSASVYSDSEYEPDSSSDPDYTPNSKYIFKSNSKSKSDSNSILWKSTQQLVLFRDNAKKVAENYLEMKGIKLRSGRKKDNTVRDKVAYAEGKEDSKKINVKAGRIKGTPEKSARSGKEVMRV